MDADTSTAPLFSRKQSGQEEGEGEKEGERKEERKGEGEAAEEEEAVRPGAGACVFAVAYPAQRLSTGDMVIKPSNHPDMAIFTFGLIHAL